MLSVNQNNNRRNLIVFFSLAFLFVFFLNCITPYVYDDYSYLNVYGEGRRIESLADVFVSQYNHWRIWGGRSVAHFIAQVFLALPSKMYFNVCNSLMYILLIYLIGKVSFRKHQPVLKDYIFVFLLSWLAFGKWGEVFLWLVGSCNYLWTTVFALLYIYLCLDIKKNRNIIIRIFSCLVFLLLGVIAGWSNENTGASLVFFSISYIVWLHFIKKEKARIEHWLGFIGTVVGFALMILAPGNFVRLDRVSFHGYEQINFIVTVFCRFFIYLAVFLYTNIPLIVITSIALAKKKPEKSFFKETNAPLMLVAMFVAQNSMVLSPEYPARAVTIVTLYFMIFLLMLFDFYRENFDVMLKKTSFVLLCLFVLFASISIYEDIIIYKAIPNVEVEILKQKENGITDVVVDSPRASFFNSHSVVDATKYYLSDSPTQWYNKVLASRYGVNTIRRGN